MKCSLNLHNEEKIYILRFTIGWWNVSIFPFQYFLRNVFKNNWTKSLRLWTLFNWWFIYLFFEQVNWWFRTHIYLKILLWLVKIIPNAIIWYLTIRAVHRLGRVGFVPNPNSTWMRRVDKNLTWNWPKDLVGFFGSGLVGFGLTRIECWVLSLGLKFGWIQRDLAGSIEIRPKSSQICRDLASSIEIGTGSIEIGAGFRRIIVRSRWSWSEIRNILLERVKL